VEGTELGFTASDGLASALGSFGMEATPDLPGGPLTQAAIEVVIRRAGTAYSLYCFKDGISMPVAGMRNTTGTESSYNTPTRSLSVPYRSTTVVLVLVVAVLGLRVALSAESSLSIDTGILVATA
jgi:hypothetical protein